MTRGEGKEKTAEKRRPILRMDFEGKISRRTPENPKRGSRVGIFFFFFYTDSVPDSNGGAHRHYGCITTRNRPEGENCARVYVSYA